MPRHLSRVVVVMSDYLFHAMEMNDNNSNVCIVVFNTKNIPVTVDFFVTGLSCIIKCRNSNICSLLLYYVMFKK